MTTNYLKIITHRQPKGEPQSRLVSAFVFFDDRDPEDSAVAVAHALLLAERLRKEAPAFEVQVSVFRRLESHATIAPIWEPPGDLGASVEERDPRRAV